METFLPERITEYLHTRGLTDAVLKRNKITWDGERIVIPVFDKDGIWLFNKYRRDPAIETGPKYLYDKGSISTLYGAEKIADLTPNATVKIDFRWDVPSPCDGELGPQTFDVYAHDNNPLNGPVKVW